MEPRSTMIAAFTLALLAGCRTATQVSNFQGERMPDPVPFAPLVPPKDHQRVERPVRIPIVANASRSGLGRAALLVVGGSHCRVAAPPLCGGAGACLGSVHVDGDVCVLLVRVESSSGQPLESYCHDLSHSELSDPPSDGETEHHPVWDACIKDAQKVAARSAD